MSTKNKATNNDEYCNNSVRTAVLVVRYRTCEL